MPLGGAGNAGTGGSAGSHAELTGGNAGTGSAGTGNLGGRGAAAGEPGDAGAPSAGEPGAAGAHEVRTKNGLPIGDCTEPTAEELAASGCPAVLEPGAPCTQIEATCRSEILTDDRTRSVQNYFTCQEDGHLGGGSGYVCGKTCNGSAGNDATLDISDCSSRPFTECDTTNVNYPYLAQDKADHELARIIQACGGPLIDIRVEVKVMNGCPYALSTISTVSASVVECLKATLSNVRWSCSEDLACVSWFMLFM
jgi:hypothetical protein